MFRQQAEGIEGLDLLKQTALAMFQCSMRIHTKTQKSAGSSMYGQGGLSLKGFQGKTLPVSAWLLFDIFIEKIFNLYNF